MSKIKTLLILLSTALFFLFTIFSPLSLASAKSNLSPTRFLLPIIIRPPRPTFPPIPTIVLPKLPKLPKPTITPTATLTPTQTPTPTPNYSFFDIFSGDQIDTEKWNMSENGGSVIVENGTLTLDNSDSVSPYPFIDSKPNPFLGFTYGNYRLTTHFRFDGASGNPYSIAFVISDGEQLADQNITAASFWMKLQGEFRFGFWADWIATKPYDNIWHTLVFERKDGVSKIYFDGELLATSSLNYAASNIWFGLTNSLGFGNDQYPKFIIDDVFVETE